MSQDIGKDTVLQGPMWPEPVRVLAVEDFGAMLQIDAVGTRSRQFYPGVIVTQKQADALAIVASSQAMDFSGDATAFHLAIEALRIRLAYEYDPHFAVTTSAITPLPHQLDAVYRYMLRSPLVRFLLADDPGAGKTIMAGLLLEELRVRGLADRILIVVPPLVARQWQEELEDKFAQQFTIIDSGLMKANVGRNPWLENHRCITSVYWAARDNVMATLMEADWDLVIVDEAHKMAAYRYGVRSKKTRKTRLYRLGEALSVHTKHLLLLTATPHKGDPENFRLLLELLDKDLFADRNILEDAMRSQENPIILRRLKEEMCRFDGSPLFPQRTVKTVSFELSRAERALYEEVTAYVSEHFNKAMQKDQRNVGFALTILQRRLTSSLAAICASLERRHGRLALLLEQVRALAASKARAELRKRDKNDRKTLDELLAGTEVRDLDDLAEDQRWTVEDSLVERLTSADSIDELAAEVLALEGLLRRARSALSSGTESKYNQLLDAILRDEGLAARGEKLLIFTEAKDTLDFLVTRLSEQGFDVAVIHGALSMAQRRAEQERFRHDAQIMIATEAGSESINLQFCNQMVNYDIPWNPNRLEQRMGRIHRIGQQNEVFIFNLVAMDTREGMVLSALSRKLEEMREGLGSDRVFDLVGDLLDDHDISLSDLIIECIANRGSLDSALARIDSAISPEHQATLIAAREEGLARRLIDLPELRHDAARSAGQALLPTHLEWFFTTALTRHRGRWERRADGKLRIERVPITLRREQDIEFRRRFGAVERSYLAVTFDKREVGEDGKTQLLGPGHPLFESVLQAAEADTAQALARGAVFYDVDARIPGRLWLFRAAVGDGTGRVLAQRIFAIRETAEREFVRAHPLGLHDMRPREADEPTPAPVADLEARKRAATLYCLQTLMPAFMERISGRRLRDLDLEARYLERSFRVVISRHSDRLLAMEAKARDGQDMSLAMTREQQLMDDAKRRQHERLQRVRLQQQIVPRAPEFLGVATVLPMAAEVGLARADDALVERVRALEAERGRVMADTRAEGLGYDAVSQRADGRDVRFLLARSVDENGRVWLKATEWAQLRHMGERALLCAERDGAVQVISGGEGNLRTEFLTRARRVAAPMVGKQASLAAVR